MPFAFYFSYHMTCFSHHAFLHPSRLYTRSQQTAACFCVAHYINRIFNEGMWRRRREEGRRDRQEDKVEGSKEGMKKGRKEGLERGRKKSSRKRGG